MNCDRKEGSERWFQVVGIKGSKQGGWKAEDCEVMSWVQFGWDRRGSLSGKVGKALTTNALAPSFISPGMGFH